ncbi:MAG: molybdopterin molybdotransferase MoeA [Pirellulales bacterium]
MRSLLPSINSYARYAVESESIPISQAGGRVTAEPLLMDRDSPPLDVSAMDGYAIAMADLHRFASDGLLVSAVAAAGRSPGTCIPGSAIKIFTGAPVPFGADCVIQREHTEVNGGRVRLVEPIDAIRPSQNIRRRGENAAQGTLAISSGVELSATAMAVASSIAPPQILVRRKVRVAVINTGDELIEPGRPAELWQIRDSNGLTLQTALERLPWLEIVHRCRAIDDLQSLTEALAESEATVDVVILTGGVSMGDTDHVPAAVRAIGGEVVFHRLPIRPGKPILGAVSSTGRLILGLPGNPVSVAVTARRIAVPLLRKTAGLAVIEPPVPSVSLSNPDDKRLNLIWHRLVRLGRDGRAELIDNRGSGDIVSLAGSDGFVEVALGAYGPGPWPFYAW